MSTKISFLYTRDDEHWYRECLEEDNGEFRVYLEIDNKNITSISRDDKKICIGVRGDSEIATYLREVEG